MTAELYPAAIPDLARIRRELAPGAAAAFRDFGQAVFADGALPAETKQIVAVAVAHVTQCPYRIHGHMHATLAEGVSHEELMEATCGAREMREAWPAGAGDRPPHATAIGERHGH